MVDPIEIKLDEIEDTTLKTWGEVQRLMRDFSRPETKKEMLAQLPGGASGGIFDAAISKLTKAIPGGQAMAAGMAGGMAAGGVLALVQIIADAIASSQLLMAMLKLITSALGLLITVILLPFLPILMVGIIWLYRGIMMFHQLWKTIWSSNMMQSIAAGLRTLGEIFGPGIGVLFTMAWAPMAGAVTIAWGVLKWLWGVFKNDGGNLAIDFLFSLGPVGMLLWWLKDLSTGIVAFGDVALNFTLGALGDLLQWLMDATKNGISITMNIINDAASTVSSGLTEAGNWLQGLVDLGWLPGFANGGTVPGSGPVPIMAHGGEQVIPAGQGGGTKIFNFYGYDDARLKRSVEDILRRQGNLYNP